ncbi:MAG: hypothetical protein ACRCSO_06700 [Sphingomonas sp.]
MRGPIQRLQVERAGLRLARLLDEALGRFSCSNCLLPPFVPSEVEGRVASPRVSTALDTNGVRGPIQRLQVERAGLRLARLLDEALG